MTDSYNLFRNHKIVFFHGLNNNPECFAPLMEYFQNLGFETQMIILPCHGQNRKEARNAVEALDVFTESMKKLEGTQYDAIAFSHGALYLQLWLEKNVAYKPRRQILLAPALFIRRQKLIEKALKILPGYFIIKSLSPKPLRRFEILSAAEYSILIQGVLDYQRNMTEFKIPSLVLIDPKDELVDAQVLKQKIELRNRNFNVELVVRPYLKRLGAHHILFHPEYFSKEDWKTFSQKLQVFLES